MDDKLKKFWKVDNSDIRGKYIGFIISFIWKYIQCYASCTYVQYNLLEGGLWLIVLYATFFSCYIIPLFIYVSHKVLNKHYIFVFGSIRFVRDIYIMEVDGNLD